MTTPKNHENADFFTKLEDFFEDNKTMISAVTTGILVIVVAIVGIKNFYLPSQEKEAQEQIFRAQMYFEKDSFNLALKGDGNYLGFLDIIEDYSWTKAANLSNYYAGISYLRLGEYQNAIDYLESFDSDDLIISSMALGATGDAYAELGDLEKGISFYKKAARNTDNEFSTPHYLFKAALALKTQGNYDEALELMKEVKEKYPDSREGQDIDKYIALVDAAA